MIKLPYMVIAAALLVLVAGGVFLATWEIPAPSEVVEKAVPDERFPR